MGTLSGSGLGLLWNNKKKRSKSPKIKEICFFRVILEYCCLKVSLIPLKMKRQTEGEKNGRKFH